MNHAGGNDARDKSGSSVGGSADEQVSAPKVVRTRFAPSPTGFMHIGGMRTALFAWAYARQNDGQFILRIEDTDKKREEAGSIQHIKDSLGWLGITWDEDYIQSERLEIYKQHAQMLIDKGLAYVDTYTQEQVEEFRRQAVADKRAFLFRHHRPEDTSVPGDWYGRLPLRFKVPAIKRYEWYDEVRGDMSAGEEALDDFVLIKADGYPTYNFAHVVDDHLMKITHVIRGEEFIASMPKYLSLYDALDVSPPKFVTVPPILNQTGGKKLSKRDGAKDILTYRDEGYLPDAIINFLASLGWNDGSDQEVFTRDEVVAKLSLDRIQKSGAKFDETKLDWLNWQHFKLLIDSDLQAALDHVSVDTGHAMAYLAKAADLAAGKADNVKDFKTQLVIFTGEPEVNLENIAKSVDAELEVEQARHFLKEASVTLAKVEDWSANSLEIALRDCLQRLDSQGRIFLNLIRWGVSGQKVSPSLFDMLEVLGKERTIAKLKAAAK